MATVALNDDQKDQLKGSNKFMKMIRNGVMRKANFWAVTTVPTAVPGGQSDTTLIRWAKSRLISATALASPGSIDGDSSWQLYFLKNLTQAVWDNAVGFNPDTVILNMEANSATMIDAPMDATFDDKIKYMVF